MTTTEIQRPKMGPFFLFRTGANFGAENLKISIQVKLTYVVKSCNISSLFVGVFENEIDE
jgi:hypothetical protein